MTTTDAIYGVPLYGATWVPTTVARSAATAADDDSKSGDPVDDPKPGGSDDAKPSRGDDAITGDGDDTKEKADDGGDAKAGDRGSSTPHFLALAGGGGEGRSGIPNEIILTQFDFASLSISDRPVMRFGTGSDLPYRMAIHPCGDGLICSFPKSCRWYDWVMPTTSENGTLGLRSSNKVLAQLGDVGQQLALAFSEDGSLLAVGGEDGKLRVFKWPSLEIILLEEKAYTAVKDLHFSVDGKFLVAVGSGGPCRVWDVTSPKVVASLQKKNGEVFGFCRFSRSNNGDQILYTTALQTKGGSIISWSTKSWRRISSKLIVRDPVSAFNVSVDGKLLAIGTIQGDIVIIDSSTMCVQMDVKKAHLGLVTALTFSNDSRALGSASLDSSVRVTMVEGKVANDTGFNYSIIVLILLIAVAIYVLKSLGLVPEVVPH